MWFNTSQDLKDPYLGMQLASGKGSTVTVIFLNFPSKINLALINRLKSEKNSLLRCRAQRGKSVEKKSAV